MKVEEKKLLGGGFGIVENEEEILDAWRVLTKPCHYLLFDLLQ
jgi:hypothetical protein